MNKSLDEIMAEYGSDKAVANGGHGYCDTYEQYFRHLRDKAIVLMELGIDKGSSIKGWADYFPAGIIIGIDKDDKSEFNGERIFTFKSDQADAEYLTNLLTKVPSWLPASITELRKPDIIIDDASHICSLTIKTFEILFPLLAPGGIYAIEDTSCSYRWDFEGSKTLNDMNLPTTMNYLFSMLHNLNPVRNGDADYIDIPAFADVETVHFYPDLVIIKKK